MKINRIATLLMFLIILFGVLPSAYALNLSFDTPDTNLTAGNSFTADLWISGLGDNTSPALSAFDITIGFDHSKISFDSIVFGSGLDIGSSGDNLRETIVSADSLNIYDISYDDASGLVANQSESFILASITFAAIGMGNTALLISNNSLILGDENGNRLSTDVDTLDLTIDPVPEPATIILLGTGLLGLGARIKCRRKC